MHSYDSCARWPFPCSALLRWWKHWVNRARCRSVRRPHAWNSPRRRPGTAGQDRANQIDQRVRPKGDPLGNGTVIGAFAGAAPGIALLAGCGRYQYPEESDLCVAGAVLGLVIGNPIGALMGRAIDRVIGNHEIFYRPLRRPQAGVVLTPLMRSKRFGATASVTF